MIKRLTLLFTFLILPAQVDAAAPKTERILSYHSDITVGKDGWLKVVETIRVRSARKKINHGIYRDFPVRYRKRDYSKVVVPFEVVSVQRDGKTEPYHIESEGEFKRVKMGRKGVFIKPGVYTYKLTYRTHRQIGFFKDRDELYWNVTGNEWEFPIDKASATVTLPEGVPADKIKCEGYTGKEGEKGQQYRCSVDAAGRATFSTTGPLGKTEGLTIVATFPKGFVDEPTFAQKLNYFFADNGIVLAALIGLVVVGVYYLVAWSKVGRDPPKGVIIPLFEPPDGLCPASVRYVLRMGFDKTCFVASVINLAVKKYLTIDEDDGDYSLTRIDGADKSDLSRGENKVARRLFVGSKSIIELDNANHSKFGKAIAGLKEILGNEYKGKLFFANLKWFIVGAIISVMSLLAVGLVAVFVEGRPEVAFLAVWLSGWSVGVFFLALQVFTAWKSTGKGKAVGRVAKGGGALFITLFAVPFFAGEIIVLCILVSMTTIWLLPVLILLGLINVRFYHLLKRPTIEGRKIMDQIEGFKMYLGTAERDMLDAVHPPTQTPELFEQFLPYALALDVENAWAEKFSDVLERAAAAGEGGYSPAWYHGTAWSSLGAATFASSFGGSFSSALSSASTAPGSSSGSGGGGSSGGGGGGGGGGGW